MHFICKTSHATNNRHFARLQTFETVFIGDRQYVKPDKLALEVVQPVTRRRKTEGVRTRLHCSSQTINNRCMTRVLAGYQLSVASCVWMAGIIGQVGNEDWYWGDEISRRKGSPGRRKESETGSMPVTAAVDWLPGVLCQTITMRQIVVSEYAQQYSISWWWQGRQTIIIAVPTAWHFSCWNMDKVRDTHTNSQTYRSWQDVIMTSKLL